MICPECGKKFTNALPNKIILENVQEHLWGICQYCKESVHFVYTPSENAVYSWTEKREALYAKSIEILLGKKNILYITSGVADADLIKVCRNFAIEQNESVGFIVSYEYAEKAKIVKAVHDVVALPEVLFPEKPSFLAEKLIIENTNGKLFSTAETISARFEKVKL